MNNNCCGTSLELSPGAIYSDSTFNSHKSVQRLFRNLLIIFSNSLMGFRFIYQLEKELLKGVANVQEIFLKLFLQ